MFFLALACERIVSTTHSVESRCYRTRKSTVCRQVGASFSPDVLRAACIFQPGRFTGSVHLSARMFYGLRASFSPYVLRAPCIFQPGRFTGSVHLSARKFYRLRASFSPDILRAPCIFQPVCFTGSVHLSARMFYGLRVSFSPDVLRAPCIFQPGSFTSWGSEGVNKKLGLEQRLAHLQLTLDDLN